MSTKGNDQYGNRSEAKERLIELRAQGLPYEAIASELGVSRQTLQGWSRDLRAEIESSKAIRIDALRAKFKLLWGHLYAAPYRISSARIPYFSSSLSSTKPVAFANTRA